MGVAKSQIKPSDFTFTFFLVIQMVKTPYAVPGDLEFSPGWEDPLEKEMATRYSCLKNSWTEEPGTLGTVHVVAKTWTQLSGPTLSFAAVMRLCQFVTRQIPNAQQKMETVYLNYFKGDFEALKFSYSFDSQKLCILLGSENALIL